MKSSNKKSNKIQSTKKKNDYAPVSDRMNAFIGEYKNDKEETKTSINEYENEKEDRKRNSDNYTCEVLREIEHLNSDDKSDELKINFNCENLQRAFIFSEIINKPVCKRRGRWR